MAFSILWTIEDDREYHFFSDFATGRRRIADEGSTSVSLTNTENPISDSTRLDLLDVFDVTIQFFRLALFIAINVFFEVEPLTYPSSQAPLLGFGSQLSLIISIAMVIVL